MKAFGAVFVGLLLVAAAAAGWKFWDIHPFIAFLLGGTGVSLIGFGFGVRLT